MPTPDAGNQSSFSSHCRRAAAVLLVAASLLLVAGCGADVDRQPQTARPTEDTQKDFDDLEVHYNAVRTDQLTPEVARAYGIERSPSRVLLNVAMLTKTPGGAAKPVDGAVSASAHNLNGQLKSLTMRRVQEGPAVYFIGEVGISGDEILVFDIDVEPVTGGGRRSVQFKREFFGD
ncbi:MAG: DUF4426 domain-containing protein [Gammaproteobacteria bacterium]|nr:DUF4426 domain-containing protein [Gammaproteobacteria bacterium]